MRHAALTVPLLIVACVQPAAVPAPAMSTLRAEPPLFLVDGEALLPLPNGGRVPVTDGSAVLSFDPYPVAERSDLVVTVFDERGEPTTADVLVIYEMRGMDHGRFLQHATAEPRGYRMALTFPMTGPWQCAVSIARGGEISTAVVILAVGRSR